MDALLTGALAAAIVLSVGLLFLLALASLLFAAQVMSALLVPTRAAHRAEHPGSRPRVAVLVPAHNEAAGIERTVRGLQAQLIPGDRLLVVADNCDDATAAEARRLGAEVSERHDLQRVGKGYALDHGMRVLAAAPPEVVIIVDADCGLDPGTVDMLSRRAVACGRPVQALDLMLPPPGAGLMTRVAAFAWLVKNQVRPLGYQRWGLPCQLMGTGMALPWPLITTAALANGELVEDVRLGIELTARGAAPVFCPEARVTSYFPHGAAAVKAQRYRWEHGHLGVMMGLAPAALWRALRSRDLVLAMLSVDLMVPPLSLLAGTCLLAVAAALGIFLARGMAWPLLVASAATTLLFGALLLSWRRFGRATLSFWDLCRAAGYLFWKLPVYARFLVARHVAWTRTKRD